MTYFTRTCVIDVATQLVTGSGALLTADGASVGREVVTQGDVAWDACDCGQLAVSITRISRSNAFPNDVRPTAQCYGGARVADMSLSIVRCVPGPDINGNPPGPASLIIAAQRGQADEFIIRNYVTCYLASLVDAGIIMDFSVGDTTMIGPSGGCGGSQLEIRVAWIDCGGC